MSHTERLRRSPNASGQLTGITPAVLDKLLADLTPAMSKPRQSGRTDPAASDDPAPAASTPSTWPTAR